MPLIDPTLLEREVKSRKQEELWKLAEKYSKRSQWALEQYQESGEQ